MRFLALALAGVACAPAAAAAELPRLHIRVAEPIRDDPKVPARVRLGGRAYRAGIELRGQQSQRHPKKPYALETERRVALLGMPPERDWVLNAAYTDPTLMRDALAHSVARRLGLAGSRTRYVALHLNGRYRGVYVLMERPELGRRRVQGAALLEMTGPLKLDEDDEWFRSATGRPIVFAEPDEADDADARAARAALERFEAALAGGGGWREHLDEATALDYLIHSELLKNQDVFYSSTFLHLRADGKLALGPVWDLDLTAGNAVDALLASPEGFILGDRPWAGALLADPAFGAALAARWRALRAAGLLEAVLGDVDRLAAALRGEARRNFRRWRILGTPVFRNQITYASHGRAVTALREWLARRAAWLDQAWGPSTGSAG
jgi:hypothetical protein